MKKNEALAGAAILLVVAGGAFYTGTSYAKSKAPVVQRGQFATNFPGGALGRGTRTNGGFTGGTIISTANGSISIKQQNGSSTEIVLLSPTTQIFKQAAGTVSDLTTGTEVTVVGTTNSDGSVTASSVQIRPAGTSAGMQNMGGRGTVQIQAQ